MLLPRSTLAHVPSPGLTACSPVPARGAEGLRQRGKAQSRVKAGRRQAGERAKRDGSTLAGETSIPSPPADLLPPESRVGVEVSASSSLSGGQMVLRLFLGLIALALFRLVLRAVVLGRSPLEGNTP